MIDRLVNWMDRAVGEAALAVASRKALPTTGSVTLGPERGSSHGLASFEEALAMVQRAAALLPGAAIR